ncbi:MAG: sensor histidine kinase [Phocaeicola sp.]|uniref:sensor histidine kinase n=1 Tax=Phocaeicola TaxID=909656 RepID=UPI00234F43A2|nr:HAMP domain-containing sensor histidine kinase [Phocaeicola oris]
MFAVLYFISRRVAKRTIQPLQDALEREKSFTSYASHEFRTPLAVLKGSMEVLIRKPRTQEEYERKIAENIKVVDGMNIMVDNLLTLTRLENGKPHLHPAVYGVRDMLIESCSNHSDAVMKRRLEVDFVLPADDFVVRTDRNALMTILNNLVANAVKYCNEGGRITFRVRRDGGKIVIGIENTGRGIPESETSKVFNQFYRSIRSGDQRISGYGLGLAIVSRFADMIGAEVTFTSCEEGPTLVEVTL